MKSCDTEPEKESHPATEPVKPTASSLFKSSSAAETDTTFANRLTEMPTRNVLEFEYFYNGGGVAVAAMKNNGYWGSTTVKKRPCIETSTKAYAIALPFGYAH